MTNILIATKNSDKFKLLSNLLINVNPKVSFQFFLLSDFKIDFDVEENGNIEDRAQQKAQFYTQEYLSKNSNIKMDYILGVDDGIIIDKLGEKTPETKKMVDLIINNNLLDLGDRVTIVRACCFVSVANNSETTFTTEIPFKYIGNEKQITKIEGKYPLSYLLSYVDNEKAIVDCTEQETKEYDIRYCSKIKELFS